MGHELSMYFKGVSCIYSLESTDILRHIISCCHIALHVMTSFILYDCVFIGAYKVIDIWLPLFDKTRPVSVI